MRTVDSALLAPTQLGSHSVPGAPGVARHGNRPLMASRKSPTENAPKTGKPASIVTGVLRSTVAIGRKSRPAWHKALDEMIMNESTCHHDGRPRITEYLCLTVFQPKGLTF